MTPGQAPGGWGSDPGKSNWF